MKKFSGKVFAGVFAAAVMASAAFATVSAGEYVKNPNWTKPSTSQIGDQEFENLKKGQDGSVSAKTGVKLTEEALKMLKDKEAGLDIYLSDAKVSVSAVQVSKLSKLSIAVGVSTVSGADQTADKVSVPANSLLIQPVFADGDFEVTITVDLPAGIDTKNAKLYHCDGKGNVFKASGLTINKDGSASITVSHASYYIISAGAVKTADGKDPADAKDDKNEGTTNSGSDNKGEGNKENVDTGVTLPIALVVLAGGSVAVSAIAAKKRK